MAEIKNHTLNSCCGRPLCGLDFAGAKSACTEVERGSLNTTVVVHG